MTDVRPQSPDIRIGASIPRSGALRLAAGRGRYTDDLDDPMLGHVVFVRSPHAHARILEVDLTAVRASEGIIAAYAGRNLLAVCKPWKTVLQRLPQHRSALQHALAVDEACWKGEAVVAIIGETRAAAEDAVRFCRIMWEELPALTSFEAAVVSDAPRVHSSLDTNLALDESILVGDVDAAFAEAHVVVSQTFTFGRQTGVSLEPRSIIARFDRLSGEMTIHQSHQAPFQMREIYAAQLDLPVERVRITCPDVGGAFGLKLHAYADELAVVAMARLIDRPLKFIADRLESFESDAHAREARIFGRMALAPDGAILAMDIDVQAGFGAYSCYPRGSVGEALQAMQLCGAPYRMGAFRGRVRGAFQNKVPTGAYRGVGQPMAFAVTEQLVDLAASALAMDPADLRKRNFRKMTETPMRTEGGVVIESFTLDACLALLRERMKYDELRAKQIRLREQNVWRGIGLCAFVEITGAGSSLYGPQGLRVSGLEGCRVSLEPSGLIRCATSVTDQGQGTLAGLCQIIAATMGVSMNDIRIEAGNTALTPYCGGAWASRGIPLGGEAALRATTRLRDNVLKIAASLLQANTENLDIRSGQIVNAAGLPQMSLGDLAAHVHFRTHEIPLEDRPDLEVLVHFAPPNLPHLASNGIIAAHVEVDPELGTVRVLNVFVADDCGRIVNPLLVDEQIRGGVVQGIGAALFEECIYSEDGQLTNGSLADYMLPLASEMPDISIHHIATPTGESLLGARGVGEAGVVGGIGAIWTAVNDALKPSGRTVAIQPFTAERILDALAARDGM